MVTRSDRLLTLIAFAFAIGGGLGIFVVYDGCDRSAAQYARDPRRIVYALVDQSNVADATFLRGAKDARDRPEDAPRSRSTDLAILDLGSPGSTPLLDRANEALCTLPAPVTVEHDVPYGARQIILGPNTTSDTEGLIAALAAQCVSPDLCDARHPHRLRARHEASGGPLFWNVLVLLGQTTADGPRLAMPTEPADASTDRATWCRQNRWTAVRFASPSNAAEGQALLAAAEHNDGRPGSVPVYLHSGHNPRYVQELDAAFGGETTVTVVDGDALLGELTRKPDLPSHVIILSDRDFAFSAIDALSQLPGLVHGAPPTVYAADAWDDVAVMEYAHHWGVRVCDMAMRHNDRLAGLDEPMLQRVGRANADLVSYSFGRDLYETFDHLQTDAFEPWPSFVLNDAGQQTSIELNLGGRHSLWRDASGADFTFSLYCTTGDR